MEKLLTVLRSLLEIAPESETKDAVTYFLDGLDNIYWESNRGDFYMLEVKNGQVQLVIEDFAITDPINIIAAISEDMVDYSDVE